MKPTLRLHSVGGPVAELQSRLNQMMPERLPPLAIDSDFGQRTLQRVREFQVKKGLVVDGVVGPATWAALEGKPPPATGYKPVPAPPVPQSQWTPVNEGACLRCMFGTSVSTLHLLPPNRPASIGDSAPVMNIRPFGMCQSLANPMVAAATAAAQGQFTPQPCIPVVTGGWSGGNPSQLVGPTKLPALSAKSLAACNWGGIISIKA